NAPLTSFPVNVTLLNYDRGFGQYADIMPNTQQATSLYSGQGLVSTTSTLVIAPTANYAIVDCELIIPAVTLTAAGGFAGTFSLKAGSIVVTTDPIGGWTSAA